MILTGVIMPKNFCNRRETVYCNHLLYNKLYDIQYIVQNNFLEIIVDDIFRPFEAIPNWNFH